MSEFHAKKLAKRAKQREVNLERAKNMRALWHNKISTSSIKKNKVPAINIGCSGWFYWDWRGKIYPANSNPNEWFKIYGRYFNTVELNAPFYSWPTFATVKSWIRQAPSKQFIYTVKIPELITHIKKFKGTQNLLNDFDMVATVLGDHMGCFLYQLPPSFKFTKKRLQLIISQLNLKRRNVVEFRHASWWNQEVYDAFKKNKIIFCSVSSPTLPNALIKTHHEIYLRFHGSDKQWYRHNYSTAELADWVVKIKKAKPKVIWIYFNNDWEGHAVRNAKELEKQLKKALRAGK